jgi:hypothetical protein
LGLDRIVVCSNATGVRRREVEEIRSGSSGRNITKITKIVSSQ